MTAALVRPYAPADYAPVVAIWQAGFRELAPYLHRDLTSTPLLVATLLASATAGFLGSPAAAGAMLASALALRTPLGLWLAGRLLDGGIDRETRRDMTPAALETTWMTPGVSAFFVAELDGRVVGCVGVLAKHTLYKEATGGVASSGAGDASLWRLSVDSRLRRQGVGHALVAAAEAWGAAHGCTRVSLVCGNPRSKRAYHRLGYVAMPLAMAQQLLLPPGGAAAPAGLLGALVARGKRLALSVRVQRGNLLVKELAPR